MVSDWISGGGFFSSHIISAVGNVLTKDVEKTSFWDTIMQDAMSENILREGLLDERIVIVDVTGIMIQVEQNYFAPLSYNHQKILSDLDRIIEDTSIKAVVIRVDSPGGGVYESAQLRDKIKEMKEVRDIPIYVVMESMATSGGYYISVDADKIFASRETITGSIGVIMSGLNLSGLMEKYGVKDTTVKSGDLKDVGSATRPTTEEDLSVLQNLVDSMYERFVDVVEEGRKMDRSHVYELADGRIYDGTQALDAGLIDAIGYYDQAIIDLERTYELENAQIFSYSSSEFPFVNQFMSEITMLIRGKNMGSLGDINISGMNNKQGFMYIYGGY
ncbi:signal peptide peptidase SppA [Petrocella sp. FN5]|uniref:signal peptide peptidase SppA n=1 Tax=Petrocella sp. FN5 TaxID=3032002 RepID=UPI0023D9FDA4|nr:signal peptide peptidase SppA [Petrocella sp. FN5]MDF1617657.1 signal peptide peptidase SppA [Petrocella sp. FN5]